MVVRDVFLVVISGPYYSRCRGVVSAEICEHSKKGGRTTTDEGKSKGKGSLGKGEDGMLFRATCSYLVAFLFVLFHGS